MSSWIIWGQTLCDSSICFIKYLFMMVPRFKWYLSYRSSLPNLLPIEFSLKSIKFVTRCWVSSLLSLTPSTINQIIVCLLSTGSIGFFGTYLKINFIDQLRNFLNWITFSAKPPISQHKYYDSIKCFSCDSTHNTQIVSCDNAWYFPIESPVHVELVRSRAHRMNVCMNWAIFCHNVVFFSKQAGITS